MNLRASFLAVSLLALVVMSRPVWAMPIFCEGAAHSLVVNCGSAPGDFPDWTDTYAASFGGADPADADTISQQTLPRLPGTIYDADFWSTHDDADNQAPVSPLGTDPLVSSGGDVSAWHILENASAAPVPEPGSMMLLCAGLFPLAGVIRRKLSL